MAYQEPTRMREILAQGVYGKSWDELTDCEKSAIHELATQIRVKQLTQVGGVV